MPLEEPQRGKTLQVMNSEALWQSDCYDLISTLRALKLQKTKSRLTLPPTALMTH